MDMEKVGTWETRTDIICPKCGTVHELEGLLKGRYCSNCQEDLVKELF